MLQDLRFAVRSLLRARTFSLAAILTLAIGISATTIVYAVVDALLLRPLPFGDRSHRLVTLHSTHPTQATDWDDSELSYPDLLDVREASQTLEGIEGVIGRNLSLAGDRESERVAGASVTPGLFGMLGVEPELGRGFAEADAAEPGFETVAIISHGVWQRLFGGDPSVVGRAMPVNGRALAVIGVMPAGFGFPERHDVWLPYRADRADGRARRGVTAVALLAPGRTLTEARQELASIAGRLAERYPATNRAWGIHALALRDLFVNDATRGGLSAMLAAVALVLLAGCANVASLLIARGIGRARELTVRSALGAGRARLVRLLIAESVVLTGVGAAIALLAAAWGIDALVASMPEPAPYWAEVRLDARVILFATAATLVTAIASGLLPAVRMSRVNVSAGHLHGGRAGAGPSQRRLQALLVSAQVALSLALLIGASLLARSSMALQHADIGIETDRLLSGRFYVAGDAYDEPSARAAVIDRLTARLAELPGAAAAGATGAIPGDDGGAGIRLLPDGGGVEPDEQVGAQLVPASATLFDALGLTLLDGRTFTPEESRDPATRAVLVSARLAQRFWPGESAVGRRLRVVHPSETADHRIVGVVPDMTYEELGEESEQSRLVVYVPMVQAGWRTLALMVRTDGDPAALAPALRRVVREVDPAFATYDVLTMSRRRAVTTWGERFIGRTFALFSLTALALACIGVYGLTAHAAAQRRTEIGVRLAIGAQPADIVRLLLRRGVLLALLGLAAGLPLAIAAARMVAGLLFRVSPWDAQVWTLLPLLLVAAVLLASFVPARRASRLNPLDALRAE